MCYSEKQRSDQGARGETQDGGARCGGRPHRGLNWELYWFRVVASKMFVIALIFSFKYKKFGSTKKVESRVLEVANHVDKVRVILS